LAIFSLFLIACPKPVSLKTFLEEVKDLTEKDTVGVDIEYEHPTEKGPTLGWSIDGGDPTTPLANDDQLPISMGNKVTILVTNGTDYDPSSIEWVCDEETDSLEISGDNNEILTITAGDPPFTEERLYTITVIGKKEMAPYSTSFFIKVEPSS